MLTFNCLMETNYDWLFDELDARHWSQAELARRCGVTTATISRILSGERKMGLDVANKMAQVLNISPDEILKRAGLIPKNKISERSSNIAYRVSMLPEEDQDMIESFIDTLLNKRGNATASKNKKADQH